MTNINKYSPHCEGKQSSFVSSENGCKHEGKNSSHDEVRQFKVDGEVFPKKNPKIRCDWLLLNDTNKSIGVLYTRPGLTKPANIPLPNGKVYIAMQW